MSIYLRFQSKEFVVRITVFGSTGGTGPFVLQEAIGRGHHVTAFARRPDAVPPLDELATVIEGDARDRAAVSTAIEGRDAVIVTVSGRGEPNVLRDVTRVITTEMESRAVRRLVFTSAYGIVAVRPRIAASIVRRVFAKAFADQSDADEVVTSSRLDWTVARATRLVPGTTISPARISEELFTRGPYSINRASWAKVLVDLAEPTITIVAS